MTETVIHIVQRMAPGGIENLVAEFIRTTPDINSQVISLEGNTSDLIRAWPRLAAIAKRVTAMRKNPGVDLTLVHRLVSLLRARRPVAVLCHGIGPLLYGGLAARIAGVPVRLQIEHDGWSLQVPWVERLHRLGLWLSQARLVAVTDAVASVLGRLHPNKLVSVVINGVDTERFRPADQTESRLRFGLPVGVPIIGSIGRLELVKGHDVLIDAVTSLPGVHLAIVGDGSQAGALMSRVEAAGITDRVHFLGHRDDSSELLPCFDVFCLPSRAEGLPLALLEAQSVGLSVVASAVGGVPFAVCSPFAELIPPENASALAAALGRRLTLPSDAAMIRSFVEDKFSLRTMIQSYRHLIEGQEIRYVLD
jgi:glycosyltransferase involved in cell wall biosynthesis